ncbi:MAG: nucleotide sugar dehydrogenase [Crocinitomicaceae bacterium]|nr:nucleotide sugar dehydrogenase [Crocinitomicaceae bacterium]MDG1657221.1 nucleotide sugar dehydrogenase [Crocinitomicaceae bacterium]|tara:strand:- start:8352 stop:9656 length:1305 start_codon:yes stop_codon:yes gene_type:complete
MNNSIYNKLQSKEAVLGVIGLGYVGLPIALEFAKQMKVVGFDINAERVELMKKNIDPSSELDSSEFEGCDITFSANPEDLSEVNFFVVAVPTPIDDANLPNLRPLLGATKMVGNALKKGDYVVFESTVYPGCTEEDCVPVLERASGLKFRDDFKVGYSPERINPGDKEHTLQNVIKVVSGCGAESLEEIAKTYETVVGAGVHRAATIKVAEAAKIIENTQRDVNIALINELSIIFDKLDINTYDVLEAAGTKWNFLKFSPGLVGGHCIGVDPYYLTHKAMQAGYHSKVITSGRYVNDSMGFYIGKQTVKKILARGNSIKGARVLVMGATFKEDVTDIRNSKVIDIIKELHSFQVDVDLVDPYASSDEMKHEYGVALVDQPGKDYNAIIVAVNHEKYIKMTEADFKSLMKGGDGVLVDVKGLYKGMINDLEYWSL